MRRRDLLISAGFLGAVIAAPSAWRWLAPLPLSPLEGLPGFRTMQGGGLSGGAAGAVLVGIDRSDQPRPTEQQIAGRRSAPDAIFAEAPPGRLPVVLFTDYNCPFCRVLSHRLLSEPRPDLHLIFHELPLLGLASVRAARAALAAELQGAYVAAHQVLMTRTLPPGPGPLRRLGTELGIDGDRLSEDANGPDVDQRLLDTRAWSAVFGVYATPTTLFGRTRVMGEIDKTTMERLIRAEARST